MDQVIVADLETPEEAQLARGLLRAHGIPAETTLHGEILPSTFTGRVSGTMVAVPAAFAEEARALLPDPSPSPTTAAEGRDVPLETRVDREALGGAQAGVAEGWTPPRGPQAAPGTEAQVPVSSAPSIAASGAARPRWALVLVVLLLAFVGWLVAEALGLLGAATIGGTPTM